MFVKAYIICQKERAKPHRSCHPKIPINYSPMESLTVGIKLMPLRFDDFRHLLVVTFEITNFVLPVPIKTRAANIVAETLIHRAICIFDK